MCSDCTSEQCIQTFKTYNQAFEKLFQHDKTSSNDDDQQFFFFFDKMQ